MTTDVIHIYTSDAGYPALLRALTPAPELWLRGSVVPDDDKTTPVVEAEEEVEVDE